MLALFLPPLFLIASCNHIVVQVLILDEAIAIPSINLDEQTGFKEFVIQLLLILKSILVFFSDINDDQVVEVFACGTNPNARGST